MARAMKSVLKISACSLVLLLLTGCLTLGPTVEIKAIIVKAGVPIEIVEEEVVEARVLTEDGPTDVFRQDVGGWICMHPDHFASLKKMIERLQAKLEEKQGDY